MKKTRWGVIGVGFIGLGILFSGTAMLFQWPIQFAAGIVFGLIGVLFLLLESALFFHSARERSMRSDDPAQ